MPPPGLPLSVCPQGCCSGAGSLAPLGTRALSLADRPESHLCGLLLNGSVLICQKSESPGAVTPALETVSWPCSHQARASSEATTVQPADLPPLSGCDRTGHQAQRDWPLTLAVEETPELSTASPPPPGLLESGSGQCWGLPATVTRSWIPGAGARETRGEERGLGWIWAGPDPTGPGRQVALMSPLSPTKGAWSLEVPAQEGAVPLGLPPARAGCRPGLKWASEGREDSSPVPGAWKLSDLTSCSDTCGPRRGVRVKSVCGQRQARIGQPLVS